MGGKKSSEWREILWEAARDDDNETLACVTVNAPFPVDHAERITLAMTTTYTVKATRYSSPSSNCVAATRTSINQVIRSYIKTMKRLGEEGRRWSERRWKEQKRKRVDGVWQGKRKNQGRIGNSKQNNYVEGRRWKEDTQRDWQRWDEAIFF